MEMRCGKESAYMTISHIISTNSWINGGAWWCSGMIFAGGAVVLFLLGHVGISMIFLEKTYTYSGFYLESEKKVVPELEFEDV